MTRTWTPEDADETWLPGQVAEFLKIHLKTVYKLAEKGEIPGQKIGRSWRFSKKEIQALLQGGKPHGET